MCILSMSGNFVILSSCQDLSMNSISRGYIYIYVCVCVCEKREVWFVSCDGGEEEWERLNTSYWNARMESSEMVFNEFPFYGKRVHLM